MKSIAGNFSLKWIYTSQAVISDNCVQFLSEVLGESTIRSIGDRLEKVGTQPKETDVVVEKKAVPHLPPVLRQHPTTTKFTDTGQSSRFHKKSCCFDFQGNWAWSSFNAISESSSLVSGNAVSGAVSISTLASTPLSTPLSTPVSTALSVLGSPACSTTVSRPASATSKSKKTKEKDFSSTVWKTP